MDSLNSQVVAEILSFLPLAVATRFKTVCKEWNQLISDPYFRRLRAQRRCRRHRVVGFFHGSKPNAGCDLLCHTPLPCTAAAAARTTTWSLDGHRYLSVLAVCDGLLFVAANNCGGEIKKVYYVWNPSNKSFTRIPPPPMMLTYLGLAKDSSCSSDSSYDVVTFCFYMEACFVYSRRTSTAAAAAAAGGGGTWTQLNMQQPLRLEYYMNIISTDLNAVGAACARRSLHWLTNTGGILALDIGKGAGGARLREMDPPRRGLGVVKIGCRGSNVLLGSADDDLYYLLADGSSGGAVELWVLENYEEVRWRRVVELGPGTCSTSTRVLPPVVYVDGGSIAILKEEGRTASFYDASNGKWEGDYPFADYLHGFRCFFPFIKDVTVLEEEGGEEEI